MMSMHENSISEQYAVDMVKKKWKKVNIKTMDKQLIMFHAELLSS